MTTRRQTLHPFEDAGLTAVYLENGYRVAEHPIYGPCTGYEDISGLTAQVAVALALRRGRLRGVEFQYIRKALRLPRTEVALRFGRTELTVTNWETRNKVPLEASLLMKQNCLRHFGFDGAVMGVLDQQGETDFSDARIVMQFDSKQRKWTSNFHPRVKFPGVGRALPASFEVQTSDDYLQGVMKAIKDHLVVRPHGHLYHVKFSAAKGKPAWISDAFAEDWSNILDQPRLEWPTVSEGMTWPYESAPEVGNVDPGSISSRRIQ